MTQIKPKHDNGGFSLIETAILATFAAVLLVLIIQLLDIKTQEYKRRSTIDHMKAIETQLTKFMEENKRLPCAASLVETLDSNRFGEEIVTTAPDEKGCDPSPTPPGTFDVTSSGGKTVRIGMVPTRSLNLPDDFASDLWGNRVFYAVTVDQARGGRYTANGGSIRVLDETSNSVIMPANSASYFLVAPGPSALGSYKSGGVRVGNCSGTYPLEQQNCDLADGTFRAPPVSMAEGSQYFDDIVLFPKNSSRLVFAIPPETDLRFLRNSTEYCPQGWYRKNPQIDKTYLICTKL